MRPASASAPLRTARRKGPCSRRSQRRRRARASGMLLATTARSDWACWASTPKLAGSQVSSRVLISRASTGAAPSVPIATVTGARSTMAGMMKVESSGASTTLTGMPRALAARETAASSCAVAGGGIDEALALEVAGEEHAQHDPDGVALLQLAQLVGDGLGDDGDVGAGLQQQPHLLRRLLAAADHQHVRLVEVGKEGKVLHAPQAPARVTSRPSRCLSQIS